MGKVHGQIRRKLYQIIKIPRQIRLKPPKINNISRGPRGVRLIEGPGGTAYQGGTIIKAPRVQDQSRLALLHGAAIELQRDLPQTWRPHPVPIGQEGREATDVAIFDGFSNLSAMLLDFLDLLNPAGLLLGLSF